MAIDWFGFGYAFMLVAGGFTGFSRKGSIVSLAAGLVFGLLAAVGALRVSYNPRDIKISLSALYNFEATTKKAVYRNSPTTIHVHTVVVQGWHNPVSCCGLPCNNNGPEVQSQ
ncbi:transmembrane protein 14C-like isoform X1 [Dendrobates tinctorius]|uniref:transmembrane protein 14C-like isoform X1 n=1 Tax=Dendrobates tinctorius TaxID=92724 RepID=UPI003CC992DD